MSDTNSTSNDGKSENVEERQLRKQEAGEISSNGASRDGGKEEKNFIMVDWDGPDDPQNPKNWSYKKKWSTTLMVSLFTFNSPVASSMCSPAAANIAEEFNITNSTIQAMTISIFVLAFAIGPLFLGPMSEIYGRSRVIQLSNAFFFVWNLACGFAKTTEQLIVFRFLAGLGGSAPMAVGAGALGDIWRPEERGQAFAIYSLAPLLGPVLGPVAGAWIAERTTWRWVFWSTSILCIVVQLLGLLILRETYAPYLLEQKAKRVQKSLDPEKGMKEVRTPYSSSSRTWQTFFAKAMIRPFALFVREPIIQVIGVYIAIIFGILYLFLTTIPSIFSIGGVYNQKPGIAGLHFIALGLGLGFAGQVGGRMLDRAYVYFKNKNGGIGEPEFRVPSMVPGAIIFPIGLILSGWAAQYKVHWIVTDIGIAFVGAGEVFGFQSMQTYVVDAFTLHAASALAAVVCLRSIFAFFFPLFAPQMYESLGFGKGNTVLMALSIAFGIPAPFMFWKYGKMLRMKSRNAR